MTDSNSHTKLSAAERDTITVFLSEAPPAKAGGFFGNSRGSPRTESHRLRTPFIPRLKAGAFWCWGQGKSIREIARKLSRSPSTISGEIKRNSFQGEYGRYYVAIHAHAQAEQRKQEARRRYPLRNPATYAYVLEKLREGWSPEQIAGRLKKEHGRTLICHETIYRFIYAEQNYQKMLWEYLPRKQKKRRKRHGRKTQRVRIPDRVSIHLRPQAANQRTEFGHWEGDSMEDSSKDKPGVHIEVERLARCLQAAKVKRIGAAETIQAQQQIFTAIPKQARQSTTLDNGSENAKHSELKALDIATFFADPNSAWQKGSVEYVIGLLRRYLPKGTDLSTITQEELDDIVEEINNRPRKVLNYNTPNEVFQAYLNA